MPAGLPVKPLMDRRIALPLGDTRQRLLSSCCTPSLPLGMRGTRVTDKALPFAAHVLVGGQPWN